MRAWAIFSGMRTKVLEYYGGFVVVKINSQRKITESLINKIIKDMLFLI